MDNELRSATSFDDIVSWYEEKIERAAPDDYALQIVYTEIREGGGEPEIKINTGDTIGAWEGPDYPVDD